MLFRKLIQTPTALLQRNIFSVLIYLRDHNKQISPEQSKWKLSYLRPTNLVPDAPQHKFINFKLEKDLEELLERQIFEQYKNKVLRGIVDEVQQKQPDPLWGEDPVPIHYFSSLSKSNLMYVSHPQREDIENSLNQIYSAYFATQYSQEITKQTIASTDIKEIAELSLKARKDNANGQLWFSIQQHLGRGKKLYLLNSDELIKLKYAFDGHVKYGTPIFHQILASLLKEDIPKMSINQLMNLFYACRHSNSGFTNLQPQILEALKPLYKQFTFQQKIDFLLTFTLSTKPIKYQKRVERRRKNQFRELAGSFLFRLNLWELQLNQQRVIKLIFSLAKLRIPNTKFITLPILNYINENFQEFTSNKEALFHSIVYIPELQNYQGVGDQSFMMRLKQVAVSKWLEYNKIEQIRMVHSFWNYALMDQTLLELYKGIEFEADSTLLYYASQIELHTSSERQWLIVQLAVALDHIPLPYFTAFKRFYNYIKTTTQWNLSPLGDKLRNTEYYFNVMRFYDNLLQVKSYRGFREFEKFSGLRFAEVGCPIQNIQLSHFAFPLHQVSLDIVTKRQYIPGTTQFKQTYMNKVKSLKNLGWKHLAFDEGEIRELNLFDFVKNVQDSYLPYVQQQKVIIDYADYLQGEEVETNKLMRDMAEFDVKYLNKMMIAVDGGVEEIDEEPEVDPVTGQKRVNKKDQLQKKKQHPQGR